VADVDASVEAVGTGRREDDADATGETLRMSHETKAMVALTAKHSREADAGYGALSSTLIALSTMGMRVTHRERTSSNCRDATRTRRRSRGES
jgi:hypothetical protein